VEEQLLKKIVILGSIYSIIATIVVIVFIYGNDHIGQLRVFLQEQAYTEKDTADISFKEGQLIIPLPQGILDADVLVENVYIDRTVEITVNHVPSNYFEDNLPHGDDEHIKALYYEAISDGTRIYVVLDELCECESVVMEGEAQLVITPAHELYDNIIVIDAGHGGTETGNSAYGIEEKDITLSIARKMKQLFTDVNDIQIYYTRLTDVNPTIEKRIELANAEGVDFCISIHANADQNTRTMTGLVTTYSNKEKQTNVTNKQLAQILQRALIKETGASDRGISDETGQNELLDEIKTVTAMVEVGYVTNKQEVLLISSEGYKENVAKGLYNATLEFYKKTGKEIKNKAE